MKRYTWMTRWVKRIFSSAKPIQNRRRRTFRPSIERLEERWVPSAITLTVINTNDNGAGSLRQAILDSNANPSAPLFPNVIEFNISALGDTQIIHVGDNSGGGGTTNQALPAIIQPVQIDGYTETGSETNNSPFGTNANILIELDGSDVTLPAPDTTNSTKSGLDLEGRNATISGLAFINFPGNGINLGGIGFNTVAGDFIGTDYTGVTIGVGNALDGVAVQSLSNDNTIGGIAARDINVISGNGVNGIEIHSVRNVAQGNLLGSDETGLLTPIPNGNDGVLLGLGAVGNTISASNVISGNDANGLEITGSGTSGNLVIGNLIGIRTNGTVRLGNANDGVLIHASAAANTVGGVLSGDRNVISANYAYGVAITGAGVSGNAVLGNYIGLDVNGTAGLGNASDGVSIALGASANTIGGTIVGNVIASNTADGVLIQGGGTSGNVVVGNYIGTDFAGTIGMGNGGPGVAIIGAAAKNTVGGVATGAANLISGNAGSGVYLSDSQTSGNVVLGNLIGTALNGSASIGNGIDGVNIKNSSTANTIGGAASGAANVISGNANYGVALSGAGTSGNLVLGNLIGTDITGAVSLGNGMSGVIIQSSATANTIGGTASRAANIISGNTAEGVYLNGSGTSRNVVLGNLIGTSISGEAALGNGDNGVLLFLATANTIGGTATSAGNVISGNTGNGIDLDSTGTSGNVVLGNLIGSDKSGATSVANGNDGVLLNQAVANTIGGTASGAGNVISGNTYSGVEIGQASGNLVLGNLIGVAKNGSAALGNGADGVFVNAASLNTIGGTAAGAGNVISGNGTLPIPSGGQLDGQGVEINGSAGVASGNLVQGNLIGTNKTGTGKLGNLNDGVLITNASAGGASGNTIGGTAAGAGNIISGNANHGVEMSGTGVSGNLVLGNFIGTNKAGTAILGNSGDGVLIDASPNANTIGGTAAGAGNVISGNGASGGTLGTFNGEGVEINGAFGVVSGNVVLGNLIGTDKTGAVKLGNLYDGVLITNVTNAFTTGAVANIIGGTAAGAGNLISGNANHGVEISGADVSGNLVQGNFIGTNKAGTAILGNNGDGVLIDASPTDNTIGGTAAGAGNVISGNGSGTANFYIGNGVEINGSYGLTSGNVVAGNFIGTDKTGTVKLGNLGDGVVIAANVAGLAFPTGAIANTIGGAGAGNLISGNVLVGVAITGSAGNGVSGNIVAGNKIGTDTTGVNNLANGSLGVSFSNGASDNIIGGTTHGAGNIIAFGTEGVHLNGATTVGDSILGNSIFANTGLGIDLGAAPSNHGQPAPVSTAVTKTSYSATLTSANGTYRIEVFASPTSGPAFQGKTFLKAIDVVVTNKSASFTVTGLAIPANSYVTSTATNLLTFDTSGFSTIAVTTKVTTKNIIIAESPLPQTIQLSAQVSAAQAVNGGTVTFTVVGIGSVTANVGANGVATANFVVPAYTPPGQYAIIVTYDGTGEFAGSSTYPDGDGTLTITTNGRRKGGP